MIAPTAIGSIIAKSTVTQVLRWFGYRKTLVGITVFIGLMIAQFSLQSPEMPLWMLLLPLFVLGMAMSTQFTAMNTITLADLTDDNASSGNSLLSMIMQLSMSIGVTIAGLLLGLFGSQHVSVDSGTTQTVFMYTWLSMALIIALPAFIFARVPNDTHQNVAISRRKRSAQ